MRKTVFTLLFMSALGTQAIFAQTATVDGVKYELCDGVCQVVGQDGDLPDGVVLIQKSVTIDNQIYDVTRIAGGSDSKLNNQKYDEAAAFYNNENVKTLRFADGSVVTAIGDHAFKGCSNLVSVENIPSSISVLDKWSFEGTGMTSIDLSNTQETFMRDGVFYNSKLESIVLPKKLEGFWDHSFENCKNLKSISLPATVKGIYNDVFLNSGLESITVMSPALDKIGTHTFKKSNLKSIILPNSLTEIGEYAFEGTKLTSIVIPSSVKTMNDGVFYNCADLKTATINSDKVELKWQLFRLDADDQTGLTDLYITPEKAVKIGWCIATSQPINIHVQPKLVEEYQKSFAAVDRKDDNIDSKMKITLGQEYASFSSAFNVDFSNVEGLKAYKGAYDADKNEVVLTQVQKVSAWNGVILKGEAGQTYEADILDAWTEGMDDFSDNKIYASVDPTWLKGVNGGDYVLSNGAFHPIAKEGFVAAGRAYLPLASITGSTNAAKELTLSFGNPTGINAMTANKTNANVYFNIAGVKASQPMKGLNISNGKKFYNNK